MRRWYRILPVSESDLTCLRHHMRTVGQATNARHGDHPQPQSKAIDGHACRFVAGRKAVGYGPAQRTRQKLSMKMIFPWPAPSEATRQS